MSPVVCQCAGRLESGSIKLLQKAAKVKKGGNGGNIIPIVPTAHTACRPVPPRDSLELSEFWKD